MTALHTYGRSSRICRRGCCGDGASYDPRVGTPITACARGQALQKLRSWIEPKHFWWSLLIVALAIAGMFGGLRTATASDTYTQLHAGQEFEGSQFHMTISSVRLENQEYARNLDIKTPGEGWAFLVVEATIKNVSKSTASPQQSDRPEKRGDPDAAGLVQVGLKPDKLFNAENIRSLDQLPPKNTVVQPTMTSRLAFVWSTTRANLRLGMPVTVQINDFDHKYVAGHPARWEWQPASRHGVYSLILQDTK